MPSLCIHAHFYQPSREHPWTGAWQPQPSAHPFRDWNTRIAAECYGPLANARLLTDRGATRKTLNLYGSLNYDVGPTLLTWLERNTPELYQSILTADAEQYAATGHGCAIAQGYHHTILPLATPQERQLEIVWGLRDFERRFGRPSRGFWLPECAIDFASLELLVDHGIQFVLVAPRQLHGVRPAKTEEWQTPSDRDDLSSRAYRLTLPSGRTLAILPYDDEPAQGVAFGGWLHDGDKMAEFLAERARTRGFVHYATDGESYGHHHLKGEMGLARVVECLEDIDDVQLTTYGEWLETHPPTWEARLTEHSSWSCVHGVGRWSTDCGCNTGGLPGSHQLWRGPFRACFDSLVTALQPTLTSAGKLLFADPQSALEDYVDILHNLDDFDSWYEHRAFIQPHDTSAPRALAWLEIQRHLLAIYTSCAWFFDDATGVEGRQNVRHAARALGLTRKFFHIDHTPLFRRQLSQVPTVGDISILLTALDEHLSPPVGTPWINAPHPQALSSLPAGERCGGVICHITSLPGEGPIGDLDAALPFVDWMAHAGLRLWQILPLNPTGLGDSPYSSWSSLSGNPFLIGLTSLVAAELLPVERLEALPRTPLTDYGAAHHHKLPLLMEAANRFLASPEHPWQDDYEAFLERAHWVRSAGLFRAIERAHHHQPWWKWPAALRDHELTAVTKAAKTHAMEIAQWCVLEFFFDRQWRQLREHCALRGVQLIGDVPIYVGEHSVDVWAHQNLFQLAKGRPTAVAGVPPDAFSEDGQRWGNPLYDWKAHRDEGYAWWSRRLQRSMDQTDFVRIDHFIGLVRFWAIPADAPTAKTGEWKKGPGRDFFRGVTAHLGELPLVVEDLGLVDEATRSLQEGLGFPGMRVVQFGLDANPDNEHHPANHPVNSLAYTGTHDTDTLGGWWLSQLPGDRATTRTHFHDPTGNPKAEVTHLTLQSPAAWAILPLQDVLKLGPEARMNLPGTSEGNWTWRASRRALSPAVASELRELLLTSGRAVAESNTPSLPLPTQESDMTQNNPSVAYFCMEYGLDSSFQIYSGGLGVLAGDIIKAAHDQQRPMVAIGLFWRHGYCTQIIAEDGSQTDVGPQVRRDVLQATDAEVTVNIRGKDIPFTVWRVDAFGHIPLYLLEPTHEEDQWITDRLYMGSGDDRVAQELALGVGGVRALRALGINPDLYHFNEGHALFAGFELLREEMDAGKSFDGARQATRERVVFTTHTPVPAGNEVHSIERLLSQGADLGVFSRDQLVTLGGDPFEMTPAALKLSRISNGVAELHGRTAREMWRNVQGASPILSITNGVHMPTWQDAKIREAHEEVNADALWTRHQALKQQLINEIKVRTGATLSLDAPLIGFARRAATYKRGTLVLRDLNWLTPLMEKGQFQIVFSGKAHPQDEGGKAVIRELVHMSRRYPNNIVFLEDYNMNLGALLTRGCDVWLNTPKRPREASGTSGMKAAANGVLNLSILDGWWDEGCEHGENGWQFGDRYEGANADEHDLSALQHILTSDVLPTYFSDKNRWVKMMQRSIATALESFTADRMVRRYYSEMYNR